MADFKDRLKELRTAKGLSQQELADEFNVHAMTISGYERGIRRPSFDMLDELADYFDASLDYLLGKTDENTGYPHHDDEEKLALRVERRFSKEREFDRLLAYYYHFASPDTRKAVRAILGITEEDPDGDR